MRLRHTKFMQPPAPSSSCSFSSSYRYLEFPASAGEPPRQLKGFKKVMLEAGASTAVSIPLEARETSIWDVETHAWKQVSGSLCCVALCLSVSILSV